MGRPKTAEATKVQHIRFELPVLEHLEELAAVQGNRTIASVIREAVSDYLKAHPRGADGFSDLLVVPAKRK
jgi:hypothetical protein